MSHQPHMKEKLAGLLLDELRDEMGLQKFTKLEDKETSQLSVFEALHFLNIRLGIFNEIGTLIDSEAQQIPAHRLSPAERQSRFLEISLLWHAAVNQPLNPDHLKECFDLIRMERMYKNKSISYHGVCEVLLSFFSVLFPHAPVEVRGA